MIKPNSKHNVQDGRSLHVPQLVLRDGLNLDIQVPVTSELHKCELRHLPTLPVISKARSLKPRIQTLGSEFYRYPTVGRILFMNSIDIP